MKLKIIATISLLVLSLPISLYAFTKYDTCGYYTSTGQFTRCDPNGDGIPCPRTGNGAACYGSPIIQATISPASVPSLGGFTINMNAELDGIVDFTCSWSRSGTYPGNWSDAPMAGVSGYTKNGASASYITSVSGWAGPGTAIYTFICNNNGRRATASASITIQAPAQTPTVRLWFSRLSGITNVFALDK